MAAGITTALVGNLTADPELKYTPKGVAVAEFTVASSKRKLNPESNEWEDGDPSFSRCQVWRDYAEHVAASLHRGDRVIVTGELVQETYENKAGEKRSAWRVEVHEMGPALRFATATVERPVRENAY